MTESLESLSFESALKELETIVKKLESGAQDLDSSIADYARGQALKSHCEKKLTEAKLKVEKITLGSDGKVTTAPFDPE